METLIYIYLYSYFSIFFSIRTTIRHNNNVYLEYPKNLVGRIKKSYRTYTDVHVYIQSVSGLFENFVSDWRRKTIGHFWNTLYTFLLSYFTGQKQIKCCCSSGTFELLRSRTMYGIFELYVCLIQFYDLKNLNKKRWNFFFPPMDWSTAFVRHVTRTVQVPFKKKEHV